MKALSLHLVATAALGLSLTGCDTTTAKKEAAQAGQPAADAGAAPATSADGAAPAPPNPAASATPAAAKAREVVLPAGLKVGRWQGFLMGKNHAVHFVFEVAVEANKTVGYLINDGPAGQQRMRCGTVRAVGDSTIISLPQPAGTLVVRANGTDHLAGSWIQPDQKKPARTALSAIYGERSQLRPDASTPSFAGTWRATFKSGNGKAHPATVVFKQEGAKLFGSLAGPDGSYQYLSGAALSGGMGVSSFDGRHGVLLQAQKLPDGSLKGDFYPSSSTHETWTAVLAPQASGAGVQPASSGQ